MKGADIRPWSGQWVASALDISLVDDGESLLTLRALLGMALRRNPRRSHLLVSRVLGKHVPTDPRLVYGAGRLLGACVADALRETAAEREVNITGVGAEFLATALSAEPASWAQIADSAAALLRACDEHAAQAVIAPGTLVLGYAETATGLGHAVADALGADYLHSTRRMVVGVAPVAGFEEEHSHATSHQLLPVDPAMLARDAPLVLVDDELSTGQTIMNTILALHRLHPRERYVIAALVDLRSAEDRERLSAVARQLGVRVDTVSLARGQLVAPPDVLARGQALVAASRFDTCRSTEGRGVIHRYPRMRWPLGLPKGGRHGFPATAKAGLETAIAELAARLAGHLIASPHDPGQPTRRVLVLGVEEFMYVPARTAAYLADELARLGHLSEVLFSSTTRSPVLAVDEPDYAICTALSFASHDDPVDGPGVRFAYNVRRSDPAQRFTDVVVILDDAQDTPDIERDGGLLRALAGAADHVHVVALAADPPQPLRAPQFGSYPRADVSWLLTDLSHVQLEAPTEEREEAIQSGGAHYAESLPTEYQPDAEYEELFNVALAQSAPRIAHAVGLVTELVLSERGPGVVLASLARAGTPIGVLMRRWAQFAHQLDLPHYAVSIVRGKGIDAAALDYLATRHRPADIMFVDGWTGKGAITRELTAAINLYNADRPAAQRMSADLAVLADPGGCAQIYGTREDYLIPSACLNSTVSGLVSRTVLNADYLRPGQFHGAKFYSELAANDVSMTFIDAVVDCFADVAEAVARDWPLSAHADRSPTWSGWDTVQQVSAAYGIGNLNLVKPGVGETTRVLLRRVPWKILMRTGSAPELGHIRLLADQRGVDIEYVDDLAFACIGLIHPEYTRGAIGADGRTASP